MDRRTFVKAAPLAAALPLVNTSAWLKDIAPSVARQLDTLSTAAATLPDDAFWREVRREFTLNPGIAHFNCGTLGATPRVVLDAISAAMREIEGNPSPNVFGPVGARMEDVRKKAAAFLGASPDETAITRNTTEGMNMVADGIDFEPGDEVLTTTHEHHGGLVGWEAAERRRGVRIVKVPIPAPARDQDQIVALLQAAVTDRTRVVSVSHICTITGIVMPLGRIAQEITRPRGILLACDGAQAPGMLEIDVKALGVDTYASSSHKWMLAAKGSGLFFVRKEVQDRVRPTFLSQGFAPYTAATGTRNVAQIIGHGVAMEFHERIGRARIAARCLELRNLMREGLATLDGVRFLTSDAPELASGIVSISLDRAKAGDVAAALSAQDLVVKVIPIAETNGLRFSTHIFNSEIEVERLVGALRKLV